ncbi:macro domain-containing protein [Coraliomargarita parva]|uniref:macro domain-containing protein n=1 Tax=Coraliomargarita parva TaxID=3014050 RepID=UPI0022B59DF1|nr:macro domain-containing protein [Coraliomargarita parva]
MQIELQQGDITDAKVDAIVNAANEHLVLGAGVAGAILRKGGPTIQDECDTLAPIRTGQAVATRAGNLPQQYVIHAVAPCGEIESWQQLVDQCMASILKEAERLQLHSIAIPAMGTGIFGLPVDKVAHLLIDGLYQRMDTLLSLQKVVFVLFDESTFTSFRKVLDAHHG